MDWWIWIVVGLAFLAFEIVVPGGIIMLFFGAAAIVVGGLVGLGMLGPLWVELAVFSFLSVVSLLTLRGAILRRFKDGGDDPEEIDSLVGKTVIVAEEILTGAVGKGRWLVSALRSAPLLSFATSTSKRHKRAGVHRCWQWPSVFTCRSSSRRRFCWAD